jgi:hypothetical protein
MKNFKLGKAKGILGIGAALIAAFMAFNDARATQLLEDEVEELKEKVSKLSDGKES